MNQEVQVSEVTKPQQKDQVPAAHLATEFEQVKDPFAAIERWHQSLKHPTASPNDTPKIKNSLPLASSPRQNRQSQAALRSDEDDGEYDVKSICAKWDEWFLIEWDGEWSEKDWVLRENISETLVESYERQYPGADLAGDLTASRAKRGKDGWWYKVLWRYAGKNYGIWVEEKKLDRELAEKYKLLTADRKLPARRRRRN